MRRATRRGAIGASAAHRNPGTGPIHISFDTMARPLGATPLRRACSGAAAVEPGRWPPLARSEGENRRKIDLPAEARNVPSRPPMNVAIAG